MICEASPCSTIRPLCITMMRSASMSTTARSCVMNRHAKPISACSVLNSSSTFACTDTSSAEVGSSAMSRLGLSASARASDARWRWPPESSCGKRFIYARGSCTISSSSPTYCFACETVLYRPCTMSGSATFSRIVMSGSKELPGSWNTKPICSRSGLNLRSLKSRISMPSTLSEPAEMRCKPAMARPVVDLPEPDSPTNPSTSDL